MHCASRMKDSLNGFVDIHFMNPKTYIRFRRKTERPTFQHTTSDVLANKHEDFPDVSLLFSEPKVDLYRGCEHKSYTVLAIFNACRNLETNPLRIRKMDLRPYCEVLDNYIGDGWRLVAFWNIFGYFRWGRKKGDFEKVLIWQRQTKIIRLRQSDVAHKTNNIL